MAAQAATPQAMMPELLTWETALLAAVCAVSALAAVAFLSGAGRPRAPAPPADPVGPVFLFEGRDLADASVEISALGAADPAGTGWDRLRGALVGAYPSFPAAPEMLSQGERRVLGAHGGVCAGAVVVERIGSAVRVCLAADSLDPAPSPAGRESELETLRMAMDATPYPVWRADAQGRVGWHNAAYATLARRLGGRDADLSAPLFPPDADALRPGRKTRLSISPEGQDHRLWFDVTVIRQTHSDLYCAVDINAVVDAETAQRNFVQTLAKTFAQLSIGLAIFDRNRQLALFNPALIDLTSLPADFLSARPTLLGFFDRLRDLRMMPEPKDYATWRQQMADLVAAAADGRYQETWSLPSGSVYSVSGRPHPDGAVAFLIEDITAEITLTRRFRSELELGQAIADRLDEAIAVFAGDGTMVFSNEPFHGLWGIDPDRSFALVTVVDATRVWQTRCAPTPVWGELRDFVASRENRADWGADVVLLTGTALRCMVSPIHSGATLVRFAPRPAGAAQPAIPPVSRIAPARA